MFPSLFTGAERDFAVNFNHVICSSRRSPLRENLVVTREN